MGKNVSTVMVFLLASNQAARAGLSARPHWATTLLCDEKNIKSKAGILAQLAECRAQYPKVMGLNFEPCLLHKAQFVSVCWQTAAVGGFPELVNVCFPWR